MVDWSKVIRENGKFENPTRTKPKGFRDLLKWVLTEKRTPWPTWVEQIKKAQVEIFLEDNEIHCVMINHATVLIQTSAGNILTDPVFSDRVSPFQWAGPKRRKAPGVKLQDLPRIDVVLISHNHYDHMDLASLKKIWKKHDPLFVMPLENFDILKGAGIDSQKAVELDWWQQHVVSDQLKISLTPAQHWSNRSLKDRNRSLWGGFWIEVAQFKIFFAGDTGYASHFESLRQKWGSPDLSFLPIGAYEPRWFMRDNHMNPEDAVQAHLDLQARQSVAIHWGTWQLTNEGLRDPVVKLEQAMQKFSLPSEQFRILENGEHLAMKTL